MSMSISKDKGYCEKIYNNAIKKLRRIYLYDTALRPFKMLLDYAVKINSLSNQ